MCISVGRGLSLKRQPCDVSQLAAIFCKNNYNFNNSENYIFNATVTMLKFQVVAIPGRFTSPIASLPTKPRYVFFFFVKSSHLQRNMTNLGGEIMVMYR